MDAPPSFALTKIRPPRPRAGALLERPLLEWAVAEALARHKAVLLCAAAGWGKTATLARVLDRCADELPAAWVSVEAGDDLLRLLPCLLAALEPFDPPWRRAPEAFVAAAADVRPEALPAMVADLVNTLDACGTPHGVIAFDDLHHVEDERCLRFLDLLLQQLTPRWTLAMTARHEPALRLARLRAGGELAEFREARLRFSEPETLAWLAAAGITEAAARDLHSRTAGWPAGLRLALNTPGGTHTIDRQAFDFLAAEVLARIDPGLAEFLLLTSVLAELDPARAAAVSGDALAARWLDEVERLGLFATVVDEAVPTLRLHDLFRDALRHRLRVDRPALWQRQLERAARLETDPLRAQGLLLAAGSHDDAARLLLQHAADISREQGGVARLLRMCEDFPAAFADTSPELQRVQGMVRWMVWETVPAEHHLARAEALFAARGDPAGALLARLHRSVLLVALGRLTDAQAILDPVPDDPGEHEARVVLALARTWHALEGCHFDAVAPAFDRLVRVLESKLELRWWHATMPPPRQTPCRGIAPMLARWADGAAAICDDRPLPLRVGVLLTRGWLQLWHGDLDGASVQLARAEADADWIGQQVIGRHHALALRGLLAAFGGRPADAVALARQRVGEHPAGYGDWGLWHSLFLAARVAAAAGDRAALAEWRQRLQALHGGLVDASARRLHPLAGLDGTLAWLEGRADDALAAWQAALADAEALDLLGQASEVRVRLAAAWAGGRRRAQAAALLQPLLEGDAAPGGALFAADALRDLAGVPWGDDLAPAELATLRRWAAVGQPAAAAPAAPPPAAGDAGWMSLSARELDVLAQIAQGASNKVIARTLDLSPHTVKRHVANILDKLDLVSRAQAGAWWQAHRR